MIAIFNNYLGEIAALSAAFLWAISSVVYGRLGLQIPPLQLNFYKGIVAITLIVVTLLFLGKTTTDISLATGGWLLISGVIGIGLGDTAYFAALNSLGARRTLLLETSSPPISALLAWVLLGEQLNQSTWIGIFLTILGIVWVISERNPHDTNNISSQGIIWGLLAAIAQAFGAVISRFALIQSNINPLESTLIRLVGGTAIVLGLLLFPKILKTKVKIKYEWNLSWQKLGIIAIAAIGSTYLGIWLQQISLKFASTGIAQTFLATSPLFILPIIIFQGEKTSWRALFGVLISLTGIALVFVR